MKIDDDVRLDLNSVETVLARKYGNLRSQPAPDILECPSVLRNVRPFQHNNTKSFDTIMTKWTVSVNRKVDIEPQSCEH